MRTLVHFKRDDLSFLGSDGLFGQILDDIYVVVDGKLYRVLQSGERYFIVFEPEMLGYCWVKRSDGSSYKNMNSAYISYRCLGRLAGFPKETGNYISISDGKTAGEYKRVVIDHSDGYIDPRLYVGSFA